MAIKTVQIFDPSTPFDLSPGFDRFSTLHPSANTLLTDLVERGELPRYRGAETQITATDTEITVVIEWGSLAVAQEFMDAVVAYSDQEDPERMILRSIEIVQD